MATIEPLSRQDASFGAYLTSWLAHAAGRVRPKTLEGYENLIYRHTIPRIGEVALQDLSPLVIQGLYSSLLSESRLAAGTVLNLHLVLTQALSQAVRWGILGLNPAAGAQPPRPRRREAMEVDAELAARILEAASDSWLALPVTLAVATGMRRGEILGLRWHDIGPELEVARVRRSLQVVGGTIAFVEPKTKRSRRSIPLPAMVRPLLETQRLDQHRRRAACSDWTDEDLVIDRGDGRAVNPSSFSSAWRLCRIRHDLPHVRFHDLRHAHATLMLLQGVHPKVVSERLGHASIGITLDTYSHVLPSMQAEAVEAFDQLFPAS
jgi:integrase